MKKDENCDIPRVPYDSIDFSKIREKNNRFDSHAYDFVLAVVKHASDAAQGQVSGRELLEEFRDFTLDSFGPLSYTVLRDWGVTSCEDVGTIVFELYDNGFIGKTDSDKPSDFIGGYDFKTEFLDPYAV